MKRKLFLILLCLNMLIPCIGIFAGEKVHAGMETDYAYHCAVNYEISEIGDDGALRYVSCHSTYEDAKASFDGMNGDYVIRNRYSLSPTKIVAMKSGYVYTYPGRSGSITMKIYELPSFKTEEATYTYLTNHWQMEYVDTYRVYDNGTGCVHVNLQGYDGYTDLEYTDLVPSKYIDLGIGIWLGGYNSYESESPFYVIPRADYYEVVRNGNYLDLRFVYHQMYPKKNSWEPVTYTTVIGPAMPFMEEGKRYYSSNGYDFYNDTKGMSYAGSGLNYYNYLPLRSRTAISANVLESYLNSKIGSTYSALRGNAHYFTEYQEIYGMNALLVYSMALHESAYGTHGYATKYYNFFGWSAYDSNPSNATHYNDAAGAIRAHMGYNLTAYLDTYDWRHMSSSLGSKGTGINVQYASDPYWSLKISSYAYDIDKYANNYNGSLTDYDTYEMAVVLQTGTPVKTAPNANASNYYTIHAGRSPYYLHNYTVIVLERQDGYAKIQTTNSILNGVVYTNKGASDSNLILYNFDQSVGYIADSALLYQKAREPGSFIGNVDRLSLDETTLSLRGVSYREYLEAADPSAIHVSAKLKGPIERSYALPVSVNGDEVKYWADIKVNDLPLGDYTVSISTHYDDAAEYDGSFLASFEDLPSARIMDNGLVSLRKENNVMVISVSSLLGAVDAIDRYSGSNRYKTSIRAAEALRETMGIGAFDAFVLTTGKNFADALSGSVFASSMNAPLLLIDESAAGSIVDYIRIRGSENAKVYVLGGEGAVASSWLSGISSDRIIRYQGKDRYDTNLQILKSLNRESGILLVASGSSYPDALSASSLPYPLMLTAKMLKPEQKEYLRENPPQKIYILGGTGAVSVELEEELKGYGEVVRISGSNRYETSVRIAETFFEGNTGILMISGTNYPDGLSAGPLAAYKNMPVILLKEGSASYARNYVSARGLTEAVAVGGTAILKDSVLLSVFENKDLVIAR
ncbi:MAG: cell wall-binding repeat-containing protein [Erysipelotrichaceae bacterium]|nr:cell wall-binding repeat-containing protein [Erysipelotrichaceae bacterium]